MELSDKIKILAGGAKYDVSCSSSGSNRSNNGKGIGNTVAAGICHSFTDDGRCISLLKILMTNSCIYDCAYCINRKTNDIERASFSVKEIVDTTINFYRRNYIEGLFLSSGVVKNPDYTMELMKKVAIELRTKEKFFGYIHLKAIPGASNEVITQTGFWVDRLSVNIEIPGEESLKKIAPDKNFETIISPMSVMAEKIIENKSELKSFRNARKFIPAGQSTQMIIGATPETDNQILKLSSSLYKSHRLKRVYFSGYSPVNTYDTRLPAIANPPLVREHRLYQADWLMRFYHFNVDEIVNTDNPNLDLDIDPKLGFALRNPWLFPIDINKADYENVLKVPGIGVRSAQMIINARKYGKLNFDKLKKIGVVMKRAKYFITTNELSSKEKNLQPDAIKEKILTPGIKKIIRNADATQLSLF